MMNICICSLILIYVHLLFHDIFKKSCTYYNIIVFSLRKTTESVHTMILVILFVPTFSFIENEWSWQNFWNCHMSENNLAKVCLNLYKYLIMIIILLVWHILWQLNMLKVISQFVYCNGHFSNYLWNSYIYNWCQDLSFRRKLRPCKSC